MAADAPGNLTPNAANGKEIFTNGKGEVPPCSSCHGEEGLGDDNQGTPRTAGQGLTYLRKQLHDFANDLRTDNTMGVMNGIAKALTEQDKLDVAAHEFSLHNAQQASSSNMEEIKAAGQVPVGQRDLGKGIVLYGIPEQHVPSCQSCHQYNGRGAYPIYPTIGGQRYVYLVNQLKAWRDGTPEKGRANDFMGQMRAVAKNLKDDDIYNVATYLTSATSRTIGNPAQPKQFTPLVEHEKH